MDSNSNSKSKCAGCPNIIKSREYLKCAYCGLCYDLLCANVSAQRFELMNRDNKKSCKCHGCRNKQSKSDNTNTPVRTQHINIVSEISNAHENVEDNHDHNNVTMRTAQKFIIDDLDSETMLNIKNLRKIIEEEITDALKLVIQVQVSEQLEIIKQQITTFHESMTFFNEKFEEMKRNLAEKSIIIKKS
ncbi:unnamed protein product [Parnassius apollo]|uniref:(apollo) hypothetical protein n=1 Tax=Parnassius apollo TaxID=110799 RepID=A0A8S3X853_PARAO|nr:unnamed protein product [Parnassius apollo]